MIKYIRLDFNAFIRLLATTHHESVLPFKKKREGRLTVTFPRNPSWGVRIVLYLHYVPLSQLKRKIDFKVRPRVMLIFRAAQNREFIPAVLVMLGIQKINVTKAEPDIRFEIIVVVDVPHLGVERIKTDGILAVRIVEVVSGRR